MAISLQNYRYSTNLQDNNIELADSLKILGVTLDERITFKRYIQEQPQKTCAKAASLRKLFTFIPQDVMIRRYKEHVLPHVEYCSPLLLGISNGLKNKLEDTYYYIPRSILRYSSSVLYDFLLNLAELQNLEISREFQSLVILYKCSRDQRPEYLSEFF